MPLAPNARALRPLLFLSLALLAAVASLTPPAASQTESHTIRHLPLVTNDLVYSPRTQLLYASVPGRVGVAGNSITPIDPALSAPGAPVPVGSEPNRMALSDDGRFVYVGLNTPGAVRRYDVDAQAPDQFFYLRNDDTGMTYSAADITVMPGNPNVIAVSRLIPPGFTPNYAGVALYDSGVQRPDAVFFDSVRAGSDSIEFASPTTIYGAGSGRVQHLSVTPSGLAYARSEALPGASIKLEGGLLYASSGEVVDPEAGRVVGKFDNSDAQPFDIIHVPDPAADRVYFVVEVGGVQLLRVFHKRTFQLLGSLEIGRAPSGFTSSLVRWGTHGLAFRNETEVVLIQTSLIPSGSPMPPPPPSPTPTPSPTPLPTPAPGQMRILSLPANDLVVDPRTQTVYASVNSSEVAGAHRNSITPINPATGALGDPVVVGVEPNKMTISQDGGTIYVGLDGTTPGVRRYDVDARAAGVQFDIVVPDSTKRWTARDLAIPPGHPETVAVARGASDDSASVALYDDGVMRPVVDPFNGSDVIEFSSNPNLIYGFTNEITTRTFNRLVAAPCGAGIASRVGNLLNGSIDIKYDNGRIYASSGQVIDPETGRRIGAFPPVTTPFFLEGPLAVDSAAGRAYFITGTSDTTPAATLRAYDINNFVEVGTVSLPGVTGRASGLVRWGANGLAFRTTGRQVVIIESPLVATPSVPPAPAPTPASPTLSITGTVAEFSTRLAGVTVTLGGLQPATTTTDAFGRYSFNNLQPCGDYTVTPSAPFITFNPASRTFGSLLRNRIADFDGMTKQFSLFGSTTVSETGKMFFMSVLRNGPASEGATLDYATSDVTASERSDYTPAVGTLRFAPGETTKFLPILISDDALAEGPETFTLTFSNATGALPPAVSSITLTITSNDAADGPSPVRADSFDAQFFVRQHYLDFLGREPDAPGLNHWSGVATNCGESDLLVCRINVSAAFFLSIEFQETGYLVYRTHGAAFGTRRVGNSVPLTLREFLADSHAISESVIVNQGDWKARLEANKQAFFKEFVTRPAFAAQYPASLTPAQFVDALNANAGNALTAAERDALVSRLAAAQVTRAQALREIAENPTFNEREKNRAFVLMQYFGYLRRNPDDAPEERRDFSGFDFWLGNLERFNGNFVQAELVKAFITSDEYRRRFGQ